MEISGSLQRFFAQNDGWARNFAGNTLKGRRTFNAVGLMGKRVTLGAAGVVRVLGGGLDWVDGPGVDGALVDGADDGLKTNLSDGSEAKRRT